MSLTISFILGISTLLLLISLSAAAASPIFHWTPTVAGLTDTNDVQALAAAPVPTTILYAGTWGDGVFCSMDHGATWQPANTGITLPMYLQGGLAMDPVTPTTLYAGDYYGGGLYRSADGGDSWSLSLPEASIRAVAVHPVTSTIVLVGDREEGLYRSADAGDTWTPITATAGFTDTHVRALDFAPAALNVAYAGASQFIFRSDDAGQTWAVTGTLPSSVHSLAVHPITPSLVYAGTFAHGLRRSADWGANWTALDNGLPSDAWVTSLAIHPVTHTTLYAGTWDGQVYRSTDGGDLWEGLGQLGYVHSVLVHPTAPSVIYAATSNHGLFRGSTLHHLAMDPVASPQFVEHAFPITITARDELDFPLTGISGTQSATSAATLSVGRYDGTATLADTTGTISPTLVTFVDGVATTDVVITAPVESGVITATIPGGPAVTSNPFDVVKEDFYVYLPVVIKAH